MGAAALGVRNLLFLTGDDPKAGDQPDDQGGVRCRFERR